MSLGITTIALQSNKANAAQIQTQRHGNTIVLIIRLNLADKVLLDLLAKLVNKVRLESLVKREIPEPLANRGNRESKAKRETKDRKVFRASKDHRATELVAVMALDPKDLKEFLDRKENKAKEAYKAFLGITEQTAKLVKLDRKASRESKALQVSMERMA